MAFFFWLPDIPVHLEMEVPFPRPETRPRARSLALLLGLHPSLAESHKRTGTTRPDCSAIFTRVLMAVLSTCLGPVQRNGKDEWLWNKLRRPPWHLPHFLYSASAHSSYLFGLRNFQEVRRSRRGFKASCPVFPWMVCLQTTSISIPWIMFTFLWTSVHNCWASPSFQNFL